MRTSKQSLRKIVRFLNNPEEDGGFWLPNIQRPFVWSEEQICRLFDSIMREYPISTLLIWKTRSEIRHRKFIDNYRKTCKLSDFYVPENGCRFKKDIVEMGIKNAWFLTANRGFKVSSLVCVVAMKKKSFFLIY